MEEQDYKEMFFSEDMDQIAENGISWEEIKRQMFRLKKGCPSLSIEAPASLEKGIFRLSLEEIGQYSDVWHDYLQRRERRIVKFVPASGAASRMFQFLYDLKENSPLTEDQQTFFDRIEEFAFWEELNASCLRNDWKTINKLIENQEYKVVANNLLEKQGLNYGNSPKGMLYFHRYSDRNRTPIGEHMSEGAMYIRDVEGQVRLHFTVSAEHLEHFKAVVDRCIPYFQDKYGVIYDISLSLQKDHTRTIALDAEGKPFRDLDGKLLLRPGGHGSLISNLNELDAEIVFIKNIDNILPDHLKSSTIMYKKLLGGILLEVRERIFGYLKQLKKGKVSEDLLNEVLDFMEQTLCIYKDRAGMQTDELVEYLWKKLNRPIRVCGMVRNEGEPGGGPYIIREADGSTSLQILESSQIGKDPEDQEKMRMSTHFNPVDLCCMLEDWEGNRFDLTLFVNEETSFITTKNSAGRQCTVLERPGLWNGAMHHWNTLFVEVPLDTFSPVKTVLDLLKSDHQGE